MADKSSSASGLVVGGLGGDGNQLLEDGQEEVFSRAEVEASKVEHGVKAGSEVKSPLSNHGVDENAFES